MVFHFISGNRAREGFANFSTGHDEPAEYEWAKQLNPHWQLPKRVYVEIPQEQIYACNFILKEFLTTANARGLQGHQGGDFEQQNAIKSVELTPMAAYSSTSDSRRKVLSITLCREVELRASAVMLIVHLNWTTPD